MYTIKLKVEVLGTEFNVQAYSGDEVVKTTLNCGKVRVMMGKEALELAPDQQAVCDLRHRRFHKIEVNANYFSAWKDGKFIFEDEPLENILNSLPGGIIFLFFIKTRNSKIFILPEIWRGTMTFPSLCGCWKKPLIYGFW